MAFSVLSRLVIFFKRKRVEKNSILRGQIFDLFNIFDRVRNWLNELFVEKGVERDFQFVLNSRKEGLFLVDNRNLASRFVKLSQQNDTAISESEELKRRNESFSREVYSMIKNMIPQNRHCLLDFVMMSFMGEQSARDKYDIHFRLTTLERRVNECLDQYRQLKQLCEKNGFKAPDKWLQKHAQKILVNTNHRGGRTAWFVIYFFFHHLARIGS